MSINFIKKKKVYELTEQKFMQQCCKECGRYKKIPNRFCNDCWVEAKNIVNKNNTVKGEINE